MKPTFLLTLVTALAISACTRTDERLAARAIPSAHAGSTAATERDPLATLPPLSPDAEDREIVDYQ